MTLGDKLSRLRKKNNYTQEQLADLLGISRLGALSVGEFAYGALAIGHYVAIGDNARAMIAIGDTESYGTLFQKVGELSGAELVQVWELMCTRVPCIYSWLLPIVQEMLLWPR